MSSIDDKETGLPSMKIGGKSLDELPMVAAAHAVQGLPMFMQTDKENEEKAIRARYPRPSIAYVDSRIAEAKENVFRVGQLRVDEISRINEYTSHIALCEHRDKLIAALDKDKDQEAIKVLKKQYPPYDVEAMKQQIEQSKEATVRCEEVIQKENDSVAELREARALCLQRDAELRKLGVKIE
jgi:hypothetical protein